MKLHNQPGRTSPRTPLRKIILPLLLASLLLTGFGRIKPLLDTLVFTVLIMSVVLCGRPVVRGMVGDIKKAFREEEKWDE